MPRFLSLPVEVVISVAEALPRNSLPALALTCRELHGLVNPLIYRFVYFWEQKEWWWYYLDHVLDTISLLQQDQHFSRLVRIYQPTQIYNLQSFINTIEGSLNLQSYVVAAGFECSKSEDFKDPLINVLNLLRPSAEFIHVWPASFVDGRTIIGPPLLIGTASIQVQYKTLGVDTNTDLVDRDTWYATFSVTTLRRLYVLGALSWHHFLVEADPIPREKTSDIIYLSFSGGNALGKDLAELLTWPKALKCFHCSTTTLNRERDIISPKKYAVALLPQRHSLEILRLTASRDGWEFDGSTLGSLLKFTELRRLWIPASFVFDIVNEEEEEEGGGGGGGEGGEGGEKEDKEEKVPALYSILPRNLEELEITLSHDFEWYKTNPNASLPSLTKAAQLLIKSLKEIVEHKMELFPSLRGIPLRKWTLDFQDIDYTSVDLGDDLSSIELRIAFRDADITFEHIDLRGINLVSGRLH